MPVLAYRAAVALLVSDGKVWLARRNVKSSVMPGLLECPGGKLNTGEPDDLATVRREVREEAGLDVEPGRFRWVGQMLVGDFLVHMYMVEVGRFEQPKDTEPEKRGAWVLSKPDGLRLKQLTPPSAALIAVMLEEVRLNNAKAT